MKTLVFLFCLWMIQAKCQAKNETYRTPVILVPGDGGSRVYARLKQTDILCPGSTDWFRLWLNADIMNLFTEHCLPKYFKLNYNSTTRKTSDQPGVTTKIFHWGGTLSIEYLDNLHYSSSLYFASLVEGLVKEGYTRNVNIRGAPYDFRRAPNDNVDFVPKMKILVEETYRLNGNKRVMILAHSLGNLYTLYFLRNMTAAWKKKFVRSYAAISAPIAGAMKPLKLETSGDTLSKFVVFKSYMRDVERSMPSTPFLFPSPKFWNTNEVLISRPSRNYTVKDYQQLFTDLKFPDGWEMYKDTSHLVDPQWVPDVDELYCFHGIGRQTAAKYVWMKDSDFPDKTPQAIIEDGDGTVNIRSLKVCHSWPNVHVQEFKGAGHQGILKDARFTSTISALMAQRDIMN